MSDKPIFVDQVKPKAWALSANVYPLYFVEFNYILLI